MLKRRTTLLIIICLATSKLIQEYVIAIAYMGMLTHDVLFCNIVRCELSDIYTLPFITLNILLYIVALKKISSLANKQILLWFVPFWLVYIIIFTPLDYFFAVFDFPEALMFTIEIHGGNFLVIFALIKMIIAPISFFASFRILEFIRSKNYFPKTHS